MMTVRDLIHLLEALPPDLPVYYVADEPLEVSGARVDGFRYDDLPHKCVLLD